MALQWKTDEPGKTKGSSLDIPENVMSGILKAVKESKTTAVSTPMQGFLKEIGYEGKGTPSTVTYLLNKRLAGIKAPIKCGYSNQGKTIKFFAHKWKEEPTATEEETQ